MEDADVSRVPWALSGLEAEQWWRLGLGGSPTWYRHWDADSDADLESEPVEQLSDELVGFDPTAIDRPTQEETLPDFESDLAPLHDSALLSPVREHVVPDSAADFQTPRKTLQFESPRERPGERLESPEQPHQDQHGAGPDPSAPDPSAPSDLPPTADDGVPEDAHMGPDERSETERMTRQQNEEYIRLLREREERMREFITQELDFLIGLRDDPPDEHVSNVPGDQGPNSDHFACYLSGVLERAGTRFA